LLAAVIVPALATAHTTVLLLEAFCAVVLLIVLITLGKLNPFLTIFICALGLAAVSGMPLSQIVHSFEAGFGGTLGHIAIVVALGTMLGKMMAESGGADRIAHTIIDVFGERRLPWAMLLIGMIVGLPTFFEVGFVLLVPIAFTVVQRTGQSLIRVGLPMVAGLSIVHGLVPPHPAAMMAVTAFGADVGRTILYALLIGVPSAILAGPLFAMLVAPRIKLTSDNSLMAEMTVRDTSRPLPSFGVTLFTILLPVLLMLAASAANVVAPVGSLPNNMLRLIGNADMALLLGVLVSFVTLGTMRGFSRERILHFSNDCLAPTAAITLLVGAGGGFGRILQDSGVSQAIIVVALQAHVSLLLLAWLLAALMRLATGSATVAMTTAAGIVAPIALHAPGTSPALLAIATGGGSLIFSHVNDGGFWLVKQYFNLTVPQTFKTWSICETILSVSTLVLTLGLSPLLH
jgi:GntP family gluconate:H+ symporter